MNNENDSNMSNRSHRRRGSISLQLSTPQPLAKQKASNQNPRTVSPKKHRRAQSFSDENQLRKLQNENVILRDVLYDLEKENKSEIDELYKIIKAKEGEIKRNKMENQLISAKKMEFEEQCEKLKVEKRCIEQGTRQIVDELHEYERKYSEISKENKGLKEKKRRLEQQIYEMKRERETFSETLQRSLSERDEYSQKCDDLQADCDCAHQENERLNARIAVLESDIQSAKISNNLECKKVQILQSEIDCLKMKIANMRHSKLVHEKRVIERCKEQKRLMEQMKNMFDEIICKRKRVMV